jgi:hypothetical protein
MSPPLGREGVTITAVTENKQTTEKNFNIAKFLDQGTNFFKLKSARNFSIEIRLKIPNQSLMKFFESKSA